MDDNVRETDDCSIVVIIDSIREKLSRSYASQSSRPISCIYKVHQKIRKMKEDAYTPDMVSIGPYHHGKQNLQAMEDLKVQYLQAVLDRTRDENNLEIYVKALKELEAEARGCYSEPIDLSNKEFIEMMLLDGFFIIELFRKYAHVVESEVRDPIFYTSSMIGRVLRDLVLLENQIPISVLQTLFDLSKDPGSDRLSLIDLALLFFNGLIPDGICKYLCNQENEDMTITHNHLLGLLSFTIDSHYSHRRSKMISLHTSLESLPCVMQLLRFGVKFKRSYTLDSFTDIRFRDGVLEIPPLYIDNYTDSFFRNLIAYEQCRIGGKHSVTSYAIVMDQLIKSIDDVIFLRDRGIIINRLGKGNKVLCLFNDLCSEILDSDFDYRELCEKVNEFCYSRRFWTWKATLVISSASLALFLTAWATVFTTLQFFNVQYKSN
ncbi:UPF0481 protein At3g47200-like [Macadamia integrifolia]|uniref:UPF0481 protein At3g47200-like n=1 Tax=Macadamia integrifolia TaxID=60698 RepID=UPI001C4F92D2|nr:UPF0481 protein At3g47200-like [Macadamia integrifolia]